MTTISAASQDLVVALTALSPLLAIVALVLALYQTKQASKQIEKLKATEERLESTHTRIQQLSDEMYQLLSVSHTMRDVPEIFDKLTDIGADCAALDHQNDRFITQHVLQSLDQLREMTSKARGGTIEVAPLDLASVAMELADRAEEGKKLLTTSYVNTVDFWTKPFAKRYLDMNKKLIDDKSVEIVRIFMFDSREAAEANRAEMDKQHDAGIEVRTVITTDLESDLKRDLLLIEETIAAEYQMTSDRNDFQLLHVWEKGSSRIDRVASQMDRLLNSSALYTPTTRIADESFEAQ